MNIRIASLISTILAGVVFLSCQRDDATAPESDSTRSIAFRMVRSSEVDDYTWFETDSVKMVAKTTGGTLLLEKTLAFTNGKIVFGTVSAPEDQGVTVTATGYDKGKVIWSGVSELPPSATEQTATLQISTAAMVSSGVVAAPAVLSRSQSSWMTDPDSVKVYDLPVTVFLKDQEDSAEYRYTLDGSTPTSKSRVYKVDSGITIDSTAKLRVIGLKAGWITSAIISESFRIRARLASLDMLSVQPWAGPDTFDQVVTVKLRSETPKAEIRYTLDGSVPTQASSLYPSTGIVIDSSRTLRAVVFARRMLQSAEVFSRRIVLKAQPVVISVGQELPNNGFIVGMSSRSPGCEVRFTTDGTTPDSSSGKYTDTLSFGEGDSGMIRAIAFPTSKKIAPSSVSSTRLEPTPPMFIDSRDRQDYRTVKLGAQRWMAQNLNYQADSSWHYYGSDGDSARKYGRLYKWAALMNLPDSCNRKNCGSQIQEKHKGICPNGWHVPSESEWNTLMYALGVTEHGKASKSKNGWLYDGNGTDDFGFTVLPAGNRSVDGVFDAVGMFAYFWTRDFYVPNYAIYRSFDYDNEYMKNNTQDMNYGHSARCVED